jgi:hypothetical protein
MYAKRRMNGLQIAAKSSGLRVFSLMVVGILSALPAGWMHAHSIAAVLSRASARGARSRKKISPAIDPIRSRPAYGIQRSLTPGRHDAGLADIHIRRTIL